MLASFVCDAYCPKGIGINHIPELRWCLAVYDTDSERLPLTSGALKQHIRRVHAQARVWGQASIAQQEFLHPLHNYAKTPSTASLRVAGSLQLCKVTPSSEWHGLRTNHYGMAGVSHAIDKTILIRYLHT